MTIVTTAGSGNWNSTTPNAPWPGGTIPAATHRIVIANGHTLTVPVGYTAQCGDPTTPGAGTAATKANASIQTAGTGGTGQLIVNGTLQVAADMVQGNAEWSVGAGGIVESSNTTTPLNWFTGDGAGQSSVRVRGLGTSWSAPAIIRRGSGAAGLRFNNTFDGAPRGGCSSEFDFTRLDTLGDASNNNLLGAGGFSTNTLRWRDVLWVNCGQIMPNNGSALHPGATLVLQRVVIKGSTHATRAFDLSLAGSPRTGTTTLEDFSCLMGETRVTGLPDLTFTRWTCVGGASGFGGSATLNDCVINNPTAVQGTPVAINANVNRLILSQTNASLTNWHGIQAGNAASITIDGVIFDGCCNNNAGDMFPAPEPTVARTVTLRNILTTKSDHSTGSYGTLHSWLGGANSTTPAVENCTHYSHAGLAGGSLVVAETVVGRSNQVQAYRNNLTVGAAAGAGILVDRIGFAASNVKDYVTPANMTNNAVYNAIASDGTNGIGNRTVPGGDGNLWTTNPADPIDANPQFVDDTRNLATWYRSLVGGTPGTRAADMTLALEAIAQQYDPDVTPIAGATITAAYTWIRSGYAPTNPALKTDVSANNGGWIGAVEGVNGTKFLPHLFAN